MPLDDIPDPDGRVVLYCSPDGLIRGRVITGADEIPHTPLQRYADHRATCPIADNTRARPRPGRLCRACGTFMSPALPGLGYPFHHLLCAPLTRVERDELTAYIARTAALARRHDVPLPFDD